MRVIDLAEIVRGEHDENVERLPFQASEVYAIWQALKPLVATPEGRPKTREIFPSYDDDRPKGRTRDKIVQIHEAAEADPERFGDLPNMMGEKSPTRRTGRAG